MADLAIDYCVQLNVRGYDDKGRECMWNVRGKTTDEFNATLAQYAERINKLTGIKRVDDNTQAQPVPVNELPKRDESLTPPQEPPTQSQPTNGNGAQNILEISKAAIVAGRDGLPQLELYMNGHKWADIRYSLGKDEATRKANLAKMLGTNANEIKVGWESAVAWKAYWKPGNDPKYKDLLSIAK